MGPSCAEKSGTGNEATFIYDVIIVIHPLLRMRAGVLIIGLLGDSSVFTPQKREYVRMFLQYNFIGNQEYISFAEECTTPYGPRPI